jgi:hypothetical protein
LKSLRLRLREDILPKLMPTKNELKLQFPSPPPTPHRPRRRSTPANSIRLPLTTCLRSPEDEDIAHNAMRLAKKGWANNAIVCPKRRKMLRIFIQCLHNVHVPVYRACCVEALSKIPFGLWPLKIWTDSKIFMQHFKQSSLLCLLSEVYP